MMLMESLPMVHVGEGAVGVRGEEWVRISWGPSKRAQSSVSAAIDPLGAATLSRASPQRTYHVSTI